MKIDNNQHHQYQYQHPLPTDLNGNTLTLIGISSTNSSAFIDMPSEAENEPSDQRLVPAGLQDTGDDNRSQASHVSVSSASSFWSATSDVENMSRRSRHPNRTSGDGLSLNRIASSEARRPRTDNVNSMRSVSAVGRNSRNSSIGSHYSNESTRTRNGQRSSGRYETRMSRSQSRRRQSHTGRQNSTNNHFQRPNPPFQPSNMPPPPIPDMNARDGIGMPLLFNMPPRRNTWSEPYDPNIQNNAGHERARNNPVASGFRRGSRRFGVSNEYEQLCRNPSIDSAWNWDGGHHTRFSKDSMDQHRQDRLNADMNIDRRGRRRDHRNSQSNPPPFNEASQTQNILESNYNSTFPLPNSSTHPTASRRPPLPSPPLPPPPPPPSSRSDRGNYRYNHTRSTSARNGFLEESNDQRVSVNGATSQPLTRSASNSRMATVQFVHDLPSTNTQNEVSYAQANYAQASSSPTHTGSREQDGARGGQANVNRRGERTHSNITSSESSPTYEELPDDQETERVNVEREENDRRHGDRRRLPPDFVNDIQEEMERAQQMAIPVNLDRKRENDLSNLNPAANTFAPTLHDANGNRFKMVSDKGICYFVPQDPHPAPNPNYMVSTVGDRHSNDANPNYMVSTVGDRHSNDANPNYMVSTVGDRHSNDETSQQNVEQLHTDHSMIQAFQTVSLNEHHQNDRIEPTHEMAPSHNITTPYGEQFAPRPPLTPTEHYGHNAYPIPQSQSYLNPIHNPQSVSHNVEFPIVHRPIINSPNFDALPTYPSDPCVHQQISAYPTFLMNGEQPMVPMSYSPVVGTPENVSPVHNFNHLAPTQHPVQFPHPYPSLVAVPRQSSSPLVGFPLTPVFFNSHPTTPGTPMSDPNGTPNSLNSPHVQQGHFHYGQPEIHQAQLHPPPIFNFQAYWATTQENPSPSTFFPIEEPKKTSHEHLDNDRPTQHRSPPEDSGNEFARNVITQIVNLVKCTERTSEAPLSDAELIEHLFTKSTRVPLFDQSATPQIVEIDGNEQERNGNDQGSGEEEEEEVNDNSGSAEESPDCAGFEQNPEESNSHS